MALEPEPQYRAVALKLYPGLHDMELKTYVDADGNSHKYHTAEVYGPHAKAQATSAKTKMDNEHTRYSQPGGWYYRARWGTVPQMTSFIEISNPQWSRFVKP